MESSSETTLLRYGRDADIPVFVRYSASNYLPEMLNFLVSLKFEIVTNDQMEAAKEQIEKNSHTRILELGPCSPNVSRAIHETTESDRFGPESVHKKGEHRFYRYRNEAMMLYSFSHREWRLGCFENFGAEKEKVSAHRAIMARYLSLALIQMGIIGFWGYLCKDGVIVTRQKDCDGEMVFFDLFRQRIYGMDGNVSLAKHQKVFRVDPTLSQANRRMTSEELYAFLALHSTWLDADGTSAPWRQTAQRLALLCNGMVISKENAKTLDLQT